MNAQIESLIHIQQYAEQTGWRVGVVLKGPDNWQTALVQGLLSEQSPRSIFVMGEGIASADDVTQCVSVKQGQRLLGQECQLLVVDCRKQFDANSFSAACGALCGGGMLLLLVSEQAANTPWEQWLTGQFEQLIQMGCDGITHQPVLPPLPTNATARFAQQQQAVEHVHHVVTGHRKRPLLLTADRGRGKSSALGIASGQLMKTRKMRILLTAPTSAAVEPVFHHAQSQLDGVVWQQSKSKLESENAVLEFVAPDDLLQRLPKCDLLLIDEAAAIPLPMLKRMVEHYHRLVLSSTIHGYEGCGRGFTAKFLPWLQSQRPGMKHLHLNTPIRWLPDDPLELWLNDTFLLNAELPTPENVVLENLVLRLVDKSELLAQPARLRACFALLVNAHYQTSPNDLMQLLSDPSCQLWLAECNSDVLGCLLTVEEGGLESALITQVQLGQRRPSGNLIAISLANHLGLKAAAQQRSLRVMRIAVHPQYQLLGVGQAMLAQLEQQLDLQVDFLSTSFGATESLVRFWLHSQYRPVRVGFSRDAASGCHAVMMVKPLTSRAEYWVEKAERMFEQTLPEWLSAALNDLEPEVVRALLPALGSSALPPEALSLIRHYALGGNSFESVLPWLKRWVLMLEASQVDQLLIRKVLQNHTWSECAQMAGLPGRKQVELLLRQHVAALCHEH
ncbi:tRNA(Met) cytidine acetyltransferase TmcA [Vibrio vulnificus]|uniref:tRNA(Met) cytidine acetyltransferase TmcA n=1 Tax=Vibrio vulnificus TaxID=672 RepID=UPI001CDBF996|nr:GNAT family N-acetyltransferase [Vibrio vulnificus]MCA4023116.1 tRNA(Met) cytidine acetyltransferase [Vibrio vulnificus]